MTLEAWPGDNVGSEANPFVDCVESHSAFNVSIHNHYQECFWTGTRFTGWSGLDNTIPYSARLTTAGFLNLN